MTEINTNEQGIKVPIDLILNPNEPLHIAFLKWRETANKKDITNAMICGHAVITSNITSTETKIIKDKYEDDLLTIENKFKAKISETSLNCDSRIGNLKREHGQDIEYYRQKIQESAEQWITKYELVSKEYNNYIKNAAEIITQSQKDQEINLLKQQVTQLNTQLNVLQNTNSFKGEIGELQVRELLSRHFSNYEIKDTSGQTSMSDIHLIDQDGYLIAIECKNKTQITAGDVNKSLNDIKIIKAKYGELFVGYLFISLRSNNIPKKGELNFEVIQEIPTIWYGAPSESQTLENDIVKLIKILTMHRTYNSITDGATSHINEYLQKIIEIKKSIDSLSASVAGMKITINQLNVSVDWLYDDMSRLIGGSGNTHNKNNCPHCEMTYKRKGDLERHIKSKH